MKNKKLLTGILLASLLFLVVGISFALFSYDETGSDNNIQSGKITFSFLEPSNSYIVENVLPTTDEESERSDDYFEFKIISHATTNENDNVGVTIPYTIVLEKMTIDSGKKQLNENQIKVNLTTVANEVETDVVEPTLISNLEGYKTHSKVLYDTSVTHKNGSSELTTTYRLRSWIDYSVDASNWKNDVYQYKFRININSEGEVEEESKVVGSTLDWEYNSTPNATGGYTITKFIGDMENSNDVKVSENYYTDSNISPMYLRFMGVESAEEIPNKNAYNVTIPNVLIDENGNEYEITEIGNSILTAIDGDTGDIINDQYFRINSVTISEGIETIEDMPEGSYQIGAFSYSINLRNVILPSTLKKIGRASFSDTFFANIELPEGLEEIGEYAFFESSLEELVIPNSVTSIGEGAFRDNQIETLTLSESLEEIEAAVFDNNQLTTLVIPNSVISIGERAFYANQLTTLTIPNSVTSIGEDAFSGNQLTTLEIPNSVTSIGESAFAYNQLTSLTLPNNITTIEKETFYHNQLVTLIVPNSVTSIGERAFYYNQLTTLTLNEGLEVIEGTAFAVNNLTVVTIPSTVSYMGYGAFSGNPIEKFVNLTGNAFGWKQIMNGMCNEYVNIVTGVVVKNWSSLCIFDPFEVTAE